MRDKEMFRRIQTGREIEINPKDVMNLKIVQFMGEDRAGVGIKLGQAINQSTNHVCRTFRHLDNYIQYEKDIEIGDPKSNRLAQEALRGADVVHVHEKYEWATKHGSLSGKKVVMHHHGTLFRRAPKVNLQIDQSRKALALVSTFDLLKRCMGADVKWLPSPIPVSRYFSMRDKPNDGTFRICQSPTSPRAKGTEILRQIVENLRKKGHEISLVCITGQPHAECLRRKAMCDVLFDSFDIGLQVSGLEAMAMTQPVLAGGDSYSKDRFEEYYGSLPYIWVAEDNLEAQLEKLITNKEWFEKWQRESLKYVKTVHDYDVVARKVISFYENIGPA